MIFAKLALSSVLLHTISTKSVVFSLSFHRVNFFYFSVYNSHSTRKNANFRLPTGLLGALQTDEQYFGKGYGSLVIKGISKKIAQRGHDIYAGVIEENAPSRGLFGKLGFVSVGEVRWIMVMKNPPADILKRHSQN